METRTPNPRALVLPVLFVLGCVVLSIFTWRAFGGSTPLQAKQYEFSARLPSAGGLVPGADVRMAGVVIGRVKDVERAGDRAKVTVALKPKFAPLHQQATVIARLKSLLGEAYLEVAPGSPSAPLLEDGSTLADSQVRPSQQLSDVLKTFAPSTRQDARAMFAGLAKAFAGRGEDVNNTLGWAAPTSATFARLATLLDGQRATLGHLIASSATVFDTVGQNQAAVSTAIDAGNSVLKATADRDAALKQTINALPPFLVRLQATANEIDAASGELNRAAISLQPVAPKIAPLLRDINTYAPDFRALFTQLPGVLRDGRSALPSLTKLTKAAKPALAKTYPTLREIIPFVQLLTANRAELIAVLGNVGNLLNGRMYGPENKLVSFGTGIPTIWNEVLGGWERKLPTNRANPYPKPGGLHSLAQKGYVDAYDCRQIHNPLYLPPTGTGVPPCDTQGAWDFQGVSKYFPNLEPASP